MSSGEALPKARTDFCCGAVVLHEFLVRGAVFVDRRLRTQSTE